MPTMTQAQLTAWGSPDSFTFAQVDIPEALSGRLVIKNLAAGLNPVDWKTRAGAGIAGMISLDKPAVLGWDLAGEVVATGPETTGFEVGDLVFGMPAFPDLGSCYAEYVQVKVTDVIHAPTGVDIQTLGAVPLASLTAYQGLFDVGELQSGQKVLVQGGTGGVGHLAVQLAHAAGAQVWATASTRNQEFLAHLGATPIDYTTTDLSEYAGQFDIILDTVGGEVFTKSLPLLTTNGRIVTCPDPSQIAAARQAGHDAHWVFVHPNATELGKIAQALASKTLNVHIEKVFPFTQLSEAHRMGETGHVRGKLVINFDQN